MANTTNCGTLKEKPKEQGCKKTKNTQTNHGVKSENKEPENKPGLIGRTLFEHNFKKGMES